MAGDDALAGELSDPDHDAHKLYELVEDPIAGACGYGAEAFEATGEVEEADVTLLDGYKPHPSSRTLLQEGYEVLNFRCWPSPSGWQPA